MIDDVTAAIANFVSGFATMIALVASLTLAADYCPKQAEGFAYAILMSISNIAGWLGPPIWVSAAFTAIAFVLSGAAAGQQKQEAPVLAVAKGWDADMEHTPSAPRS